jgi:signal transduction histidine kinase
MRKLIKTVINWFVPADLVGRHERRLARRAVVFGLAMLVWVPVFAPLYLALGSLRSCLIVMAAAVAMLFAIATLKISKSVALTGHLVALAVFCTLIALATVSEGTRSPALWWLTAVPIIPLILSGTRAGLTWVGLSCLACLLFLLIDLAGFSFPTDFQPLQMRLLNAIGTAGIVACAFSLTLAFKVGEDAARAELELARQESEAASNAKSQFLANMSHEIRTPMNAVIGLTELVLDTDLTPNQRDYLSTVLESGESLLSLINQILDFSKIESGKCELEFVPFGLRSELNEIRKSLALRAERKRLEFHWLVDEDVPDAILGDAAKLRQVLINLVANAIKFTEFGKITVRVHRQTFNTESVVLRFEVQDTGIGVPVEKRDSIFREFEQADSSMTRRFGGTGLGLAITSRLVKSMGGSIGVYSKVGQGSIFHFTLPFRLSSEDAIANRLVEEDSGSVHVSANNASGGIKILVAEDGLANQKLAVGLLTNWGHEVVIASNGRSAVELWEQQEFDLILMDIQMPEMDGLEATRAIRARERERGGHIPIVALTAHALAGDRERCILAGMDGYVSKPIQRSELASEIEPLISQPL